MTQSHEYHVVLDSDFQKSNPALKRQNSATPPEFPTKIFVEKTKFRNLQNRYLSIWHKQGPACTIQYAVLEYFVLYVTYG